MLLGIVKVINGRLKFLGKVCDVPQGLRFGDERILYREAPWEDVIFRKLRAFSWDADTLQEAKRFKVDYFVNFCPDTGQLIWCSSKVVTRTRTTDSGEDLQYRIPLTACRVKENSYSLNDDKLGFANNCWLTGKGGGKLIGKSEREVLKK